MLNERHLLCLLRDYVSYHHQDRIHDSLEKDTPESRPVEHKASANATVISLPRLGGWHHRYAWREAAAAELLGRPCRPVAVATPEPEIPRRSPGPEKPRARPSLT